MRSAARRNRRGASNACSSSASVRPRKCLRRTAAPFFPRRRSAQPGGRRHRAKTEAAAAGDQRRLHALPAAARAARCLHLHPPSPHARQRRALAQPQCRAPFQVARGNGVAFFRSSRSHRQHGVSFLAPAIHLERSRLPISQYPRSRRRIADALPSPALARRHDLPLRRRTTNARGARSNANSP